MRVATSGCSACWALTTGKSFCAAFRHQNEHTGDFLRRCSAFADVSRQTLHRLEAAATEKRFLHNEPIAEQDVNWDGFGIVANGTLAAVIGSPLGREHALFEILAGDAFGEIATIDGGFTPARFVVTSRSARVVCIPKDVMRAALRSDPGLACAMNDLCAQHMRLIIGRFAAQAELPTGMGPVMKPLVVVELR